MRGGSAGATELSQSDAATLKAPKDVWRSCTYVFCCHVRYLDSVVCEEGLGVRFGCQVEDSGLAPAFCSPHQQGIGPVLAVGVTLSKHICHTREKSPVSFSSGGFQTHVLFSPVYDGLVVFVAIGVRTPSF